MPSRAALDRVVVLRIHGQQPAASATRTKQNLEGRHFLPSRVGMFDVDIYTVDDEASGRSSCDEM